MYENQYGKLLNTGLVGFVFKLTHMSLEAGLRKRNFPNVLEIGAGKGQHLVHVKHEWLEYVETDIRIDTLVESTRGLNRDSRVRQEFADAQDLSQYSNDTFDRVIVSCVLAHLKEPEKALMEWRRVTKPNGVISIYLPSEPGMMLRLSRALTTVPKAKRMGHNHLAFHYREHINHFPGMKMLIFDVFEKDLIRIRTYPIALLSWNFSLWKIIQINKKD